METGDRLLELIQAMTRQEKRYFKLYSSFYAKKSAKKCVSLFDVLNKSTLSSDKLQKSLVKQFSSAEIPRLKNELIGLILDSLASFRAQHLADREMRTTLEHAEVLLEKGLYRHAAKLIDKAKKAAVEVESHLLEMQALYWERSLVLSRYDRNLEEQLEDVYGQMEAAVLKQQSWQEYARLQDFVVFLWGKHKQQAGGEAAAKMDAFFQHPLINKEDKARTVRTQIARLHVLGIQAQSRNRPELAVEFSAQLIALYDAHPELLARNINQYTRYLLQHLAILAELKDEAQFTSVAARIKSMHQLPDKLKVVSALGALGLELSLFMNLRKVDAATHTAATIFSYLKLQRAAIHPQSYLTLCHNCMTYYFLIGEYHKALEPLNLILAERRADLRRDIQDCARAFNLIVHFELGNTEILDNLIRSTRRYLKQNTGDNTLELLVLDAMRNLINSIDRRATASILERLRDELTLLREDTHIQIIGIDELRYWVDSKLKGRAIADLYLNDREARV